ncbi:nitroreductase family protein [Mumia sp. zg.B17]|uniref:nitroreductase family protein n=1 Tax=Mumia sp. zg.B17 TaxID=2855446 RepID=UPI001C6E7786|nr:nitroreductase family protein [Mumia sp. zg.B17]MBW9204370.1 nitroreductase family protein [Mumia sp. zg.B17]
MEFGDVVRRRRMVRAYDGRPVPRALVDRMLEHATHAPSAGFSQGWAFLVLDSPEDVTRFWEATTPPDRAAAPSRWQRGMRTAPVVIVPLAHKDAYLERYAEPDKGWTDRDEARWAVPYWYVDTAMASLLILLTAVDEGLGACFFGIPPTRTAAFRSTFGVPEAYDPIGAVTVGYRAEDHVPSSRGRARRGLDEVVHRGSWGLPSDDDLGM